MFLVPSAKKALALIAANFYGNPARELTLLGITGTNGKTTTDLPARVDVPPRAGRRPG